MKLPLRDFNHIPLDCTVLVRKTLPLPEVDFDTGPATRAELHSMRAYAAHLAASSGVEASARRAGDFFSLAGWALNGKVPS